MSRRVVITGVGLASPIGHTPADVSQALRDKKTGIIKMEEWSEYRALWTQVAGVCEGLALKWPRRHVRTMGRLGKLALYATEQAVADSGLSRDSLARPEVGVSYGSTHGSSSSMEKAMERVFTERTFEGMISSAYLKFMSHTAAANLALYFGVQGRVITTCSACTSGSQGIGYGYEAIKFGRQDVMICGGAEEMHAFHAGVFDVMYATSTNFNDRPEATPRPYDRDRDGMVVGEGAGTLILEEYERAKKRGARIHAEVLGYGTNCDGQHATAPSIDGMAGALRLALEDSAVDPERIGYINGHGTGTETGDISETQATLRVVGDKIPISSTKSYTGHTLGACGAIEAIICLQTMHDGFLPPTRTLENVDERCAPLDYVTDVRDLKPKIVMNNNFAFGGINTSLLFGGV